MRLQSRYFSMIGAGVKNDQDVVDGIHLRWFFDQKLGFPKYGFRLFRGHGKPELTCPSVCFPSDTDEWRKLRWTPGSEIATNDITIMFEDLVHSETNDKGIILNRNRSINLEPVEISKQVELTVFLNLPTHQETHRESFKDLTGRINPHVKRTYQTIRSNTRLDITIHTHDHQVSKQTSQLKSGTNKITIKSDAIKKIELRLTGVAREILQQQALLSQVCWMPVQRCVRQYGWVPIGEYCLPIDHDNHEGCIGNDSDLTWDVVRKRIRLRPDKNRSIDRKAFEQDLQPELRDMLDAHPVPQDMMSKSFEAENVQLDEDMQPLNIHPLNAMMFASLEPEMAQLLGLYALDENARSGYQYNYRVEGYWNKSHMKYVTDEEKKADMYQINLHADSNRGPFRMMRNGFSIWSKHFLQYNSMHGVMGNEDGNGHMVIECPRPVAMLMPEIRSLSSQPVSLHVQYADGRKVSLEWTEELIVEDFVEGVVSIEIQGDCYIRSLYYADLNYAWIVHDIQVEEGRQIEEPRGISTHLMPGKGWIDTDAGELYSFGSVGLNWNVPDAAVEENVIEKDDGQHIDWKIREAESAVMYQIQRSRVKEKKEQFQWIQPKRPVIVPRRRDPLNWHLQQVHHPAQWPKNRLENESRGIMPVLYVDVGDRHRDGTWIRPLHRDATYVYRVCALDILGRMSAFSDKAAVDIDVTLVPPPPVADQAKYISAQDPSLTTAEQQYVRDHGNSFHIRWKWPLDFREQAPEADRFYIYYKPGSLNVFQGQIRTVEMTDGGDSSEVEVDFSAPYTADLSENEWQNKVLRQQGKNFTILSHTASTSWTNDQGKAFNKAVFTVRNLTFQTHEIPDNGSLVSVSVDEQDRLGMQVRNAGQWRSGNWDSLLAEVWMNNGTVVSEMVNDAEVSYLLFDEFIAEAQIPDSFRLSPSVIEPMVQGNIGLTTVNKQGLESAVSTPLRVFDVWREKPVVKDVPDVDSLWTSMPDAQGLSRFKLSWPINEDGLSYVYQFHRTMDRMLINVDCEQFDIGHFDGDSLKHPEVLHALWPGEEARYQLISDDVSTLDAVMTSWAITAEDERQRKWKKLLKTYQTLRLDTWQYIASLPENKEAFMPVHAPVDPRKQDELAVVTYEDTLEGQGPNLYFYRVVLIDRAGNRSEPGPSTLPVRIPDTLPPRTPVVLKASGGDRLVTLQWRRNTESGLKAYEIYRTIDAEKAFDMRSMGKPIAVIDEVSPGRPIRAKVIGDGAFMSVSFRPAASAITSVRRLDQDEGENVFGGFKSCIVTVTVDHGTFKVKAEDQQGNEIETWLHGFGGQVKVEEDTFPQPVRKITGVYRQSDASHSENLLIGISSGIILLDKVQQPSSSLRQHLREQFKEQMMLVLFQDEDGQSQQISHVPHELEWKDTSVQAGQYYYRLKAIRQGIIGEKNDEQHTISLTSHPTDILTIRVIDYSPPDPPIWISATWVTVESEPVVLLEWQTDGRKQKVDIQRKQKGKLTWQTIASSLTETQWMDHESDSTVQVEYRLRSTSENGLQAINSSYVVDSLEGEGDLL